MRSLEGKVWGVQSPSQVDWYMCNWLINVVGNNDVNTYIEVLMFQAAWFDLWLLRYQIFFHTNKLSKKSYRLSPFYSNYFRLQTHFTCDYFAQLLTFQL